MYLTPSAVCGSLQVRFFSEPLSGIRILSYVTDVLLRVPDSNILTNLGRNLILYNVYNDTGLVSGSQPILDSDNSPGSPWPLTIEGVSFNTSLKIQVVGCSLSTITGKTTIDEPVPGAA